MSRRRLRISWALELTGVGQTGGTYLHHILRRFEGPADVHPEQNITTTDHADVTLFLQHHLEWDWIANLRFNFLERRTGFLSLSPYIESDCGRDLRTGEVFPRVRDIYSMVSWFVLSALDPELTSSFPSRPSVPGRCTKTSPESLTVRS